MMYCASNDLTVDGAMTDPKGDRSKAHQTGICSSHEVIVMPAISMGPDDKDYAISFAVPTDTEGIFMIIGRQSCDTRKLEGTRMDVRQLRIWRR